MSLESFSRRESENLSPESKEAIQQIVNKFEKAWSHWTHQHPRAEDFLEETEDPVRSVLLKKLVLLEWNHLSESGVTIQAEEYQQRFQNYSDILELKEMPNLDSPDSVSFSTNSLNQSEIETIIFDCSENVSPGSAGEDGYEILEKIAEGGMGVVYKARDPQLNRIVALKMIRSGKNARSEEITRFRTEAKAIAALKHPGIVEIFNYDEEAGEFRFALEYCGGGNLHQQIRETTMMSREAAQVVEQLAEAVQHAHANQVIHRDLKPANVLLTEKGIPKVTDFGLAKNLEEDDQTIAGAVLGTPSYMAPEQARGETSELGPSCDIYALGAILYECLTGRPPFKASDKMLTLQQVRDEEPVSPRQLQPDVPMDLETICLKCLQKEPQKRYPSAQALADDLRSWLDGKPISARPVGTIERTVKWVKRYPAMTGFAVTGLLLFLTLGIGGPAVAWKQSELRQKADHAKTIAVSDRNYALKKEKEAVKAKNQAERSEQKAEKDRQFAVEQEHKALRSLYQAQLYPMKEAWLERDFGTLEKLLEESTPQGGKPDNRGWEWYYFKNQCDQAGSRFPTDGECTTNATWCKKSSQVAVGVKGTGIQIFDLKTRQSVARIAEHGAIRMVWNPEGTHLAVATRDEKIKIYDVESRKATKILPGCKSWGRGNLGLDWSPDGKYIACGGASPVVFIWNAKTGKLFRKLNTFFGLAVGGLKEIANLAWSPDSTTLAITYPTIQMFAAWDVNSRKLLFEKLLDPTQWPEGAGWSPDGSKLAILGISKSTKHGLSIWDKQTKNLRQIETGDLASHSVTWGDPNHLLVTGDSNGKIQIWDTQKGKQLETFRLGLGSMVNSLYWDSTVGGIGFRQGTDLRFCVYPSRSQMCKVCKANGVESIRHLQWSPNGKWIATNVGSRPSLDGLCLWDPDKGSPTMRISTNLVGSRGIVRAIAWSPDSQTVAVLLSGGKLFLWNALQNQLVKTLNCGKPDYWMSLDWHPDGSRLAVALNKNLQIWDTTTWKKETVLKNPFFFADVEWSPNGKMLAIGNLLYETSSWSEIMPKEKTVGGGLFCSWSGDSSHLYSIGKSSGEDTIDVYDTQAASIQKLPILPSGFYSMCLAPDDQRFAVSGNSGTVTIWDSRLLKSLMELPVHNGPVDAIEFSPDSLDLAVGCRDGTLKIFRANQID